jgi:hypothetical protein
VNYQLTEACRVDFTAYAPLHLFKGWTEEGLSGEIAVDLANRRLDNFAATAETLSFTTADRQRTEAMRDYFFLREHRQTSFRLSEPCALADAGQGRYRGVMVGVLEFAAIRRQMPLTCLLHRTPAGITMSVSGRWSFKAFGLRAPRLLFLTVRDIVDISARLTLSHVPEADGTP